jgi:hypothetical protein
VRPGPQLVVRAVVQRFAGLVSLEPVVRRRRGLHGGTVGAMISISAGGISIWWIAWPVAFGVVACGLWSAFQLLQRRR